MRRPTTWPDNMLLMCSAWFIGRDIIILSEDGDGYSFRTRYRPEGTVNPGPELLLGYIKNILYQALVPIRTVLHDVICSSCGECARSLRQHLNRSPTCRSYYNIPDLDEMAKTMGRYERRPGHQIYNREYADRCREVLQLQQKHEYCNDDQLRRRAEMDEKRRQDRIEYCRRYRERMRQQNVKFRNNHREEKRMYDLMYYRKNRDKILEKHRLQAILRKQMKPRQDKILQKRRLQRKNKRRESRSNCSWSRMTSVPKNSPPSVCPKC